MADADDQDWKAFLEATEEDDEDVETSSLEDETLDDEDESEDESSKKSATEKGKKGSDPKEDPDPEDEEEDDPEKSKKKDEPKKTDPETEAYKPRLKQFLNDKGELDSKKLEDAYIANSKEAVRINEELTKAKDQVKQLLSAIGKDPEVAKKLLGEEGAKQVAADVKGSDTPRDPIMADYEAKMKKQANAEYDEFIEAHPESVSDPEKAEKIGKYLKFYGPWYQAQNDGEIPGMKESLEAAYRHYGWDLEIDKKEEVAVAAKKHAATRSTPQSKKPAKKGGLSKAEMHFASKLGVKL